MVTTKIAGQDGRKPKVYSVRKGTLKCDNLVQLSSDSVEQMIQ